MKLDINVYNIPIVCPICKGEVEYSGINLIECKGCMAKYPQFLDGYLNLLPENQLKKNDEGWEIRLQEMELWYRDLLADSSNAVLLYENDYKFFKPYFAKLSGDILDLGGGVGVVRHYLPHGTSYTVVDPSTDWLGKDWQKLSGSYPCLNEKLNFIRGVGEFLMFADNSFDSVVSFWSMNHVSDPQQVFKEVYRVLKPGGSFYVVFEDMEPFWSDFLDYSMRHYFSRRRYVEYIICKLRTSLLRKEWPVQADHIPISDKEVRSWIMHYYQLTKREWRGMYLAYEFKKIL